MRRNENWIRCSCQFYRKNDEFQFENANSIVHCEKHWNAIFSSFILLLFFISFNHFSHFIFFFFILSIKFSLSRLRRTCFIHSIHSIFQCLSIILFKTNDLSQRKQRWLIGIFISIEIEWRKITRHIKRRTTTTNGKTFFFLFLPPFFSFSSLFI